MRQLLPPPPSGDEPDLVSAYAYPADRTWVRANMVSSVDGASRLNGRTEPLSGTTDKRLFGLLRQLSDVILVGAQTARVEHYGPVPIRDAYAEPRRLAGQMPAPGFALVSGTLDLDPQSPLFTAATTRTLVLTCEAAPPDLRERLLETADVIDAGSDRVEMEAAIDVLVARGYRRISCEGGPRVLSQVAAAGRLDELCLTTTPMLVGGAIPRVLDGDDVTPPLNVSIGLLLEDEGTLFARYLVAR